jgi:type 1 glutamine amidotransferase
MPFMTRFAKLLASSLLLVFFFTAWTSIKPKKKILVFSKTAGYHHASIGAGQVAIYKLGQENGFEVDTTSVADVFTESDLKKYAAVVFLSTTGDVLNPAQQTAFENYIKKGGGFVGVHAATDTEYDWPWYNKLVGAYFLSHPKQQDAVVHVLDKKNKSTSHLPTDWKRWDEWYNYKSISTDLNVLINLDETTYEGGKNGANHPIAWYHKYDGGKAFYTGMGHTDASYVDPLFLKHLLGGIQWAMK